MWARLVRFAKRRTKEAGIFVIVVAVALIATEFLDRSEGFKKSFPDVIPILHHFTEDAHLFEAALIVVAVLVLLIFILLKLFSRLFGWNRLRATPRKHSIEGLLILPPLPRKKTYRFRMAQHEGDLKPFVEFSDHESEIAQRHPELHGPHRHRLYQTWHKIRKQAFLLLDRFDPARQEWQPIALSIVLPLTDHGRLEISEGRLSVVDIADSRDAVIAREGEASSCVLMDTWIVKPRKILERRVIREEHEHYAICMLFVHAGIFWDGTQAITALVEPDNRAVENICKRLGFATVRKTPDGYPLQSLSLPYTGADGMLQTLLGLITGNARMLRSWPVEGFRN